MKVSTTSKNGSFHLRLPSPSNRPKFFITNFKPSNLNSSCYPTATKPLIRSKRSSHRIPNLSKQENRKNTSVQQKKSLAASKTVFTVKTNRRNFNHSRTRWRWSRSMRTTSFCGSGLRRWSGIALQRQCSVVHDGAAEDVVSVLLGFGCCDFQWSDEGHRLNEWGFFFYHSTYSLSSKFLLYTQMSLFDLLFFIN